MEHLIITIGRQLGSGGLRIGKQLAEQLNLSFYDKELINLASQESGLSKELFEQADEKKKNNLFGTWFGLRSSLMVGDYQINSSLCNESLFQIQSDVIRRLAEQQSCVFVGRCADYILREHPRCLNIFISADLDDRIRRVSEIMQISQERAQASTGKVQTFSEKPQAYQERAKDLIRQTDKKRAEYYNYYTSKEWGAARSYHLCLNSSLLGETETIAYIMNFIKRFVLQNS